MPRPPLLPPASVPVRSYRTTQGRRVDEQFFERATRKMQEPTVAFKATPKQVEFIEAVLCGRYNYLGFGGGIRGTKTIACLSMLVILSRMFPRSRWAVVRKDLPTLRRNVVPSMEKVKLWSGGFVGPLNQSIWTYPCANGSQILLFPEQFIQDPELERFKGLEVNGFDLEEGNELNIKTANKCIERAGSYIIPDLPEDPTPKQPPPLILVNFNPCIEWPRTWFYEPYKRGEIASAKADSASRYFFLPATIMDNPFASEEYKESLKNLPKEEYDRYVKGEWDFVDNPKQLIKSEWLYAARNIEGVKTGVRRMGVDVARFGDDWTKFYILDGNVLVERHEIRHFDTNEVGQAVLERANRPETPIYGKNTRVDGVGLGAGVVDFCEHAGLPVYEIISGAKAIPRKPTEKEGPNGFHWKFKDLRSQIWWEGREKFRLGLVSLNWEDKHGRPIEIPEKLIGDLATPTYDISADKVITVESKEEIKARLGRSPDDGDAFMLALWDAPPPRQRPRLPGSYVITGG
jgi:hypothetical protein